MSPLWSRTLLFGAIVSVHSLTDARAAGLDPLLQAALTHDPQVAAAEARADQVAAELGVRRSALLPRLSAQAGYTRNQVAAEVALPGTTDPVVIQPLDQLQAYVQLDLPLFDGAAVAGLTASARCRDAAVARAEADVQDRLLAVVQAAWDARTAEASVAVARAAVAANETLVTSAHARRDAGTGSALDLFRAEADLGAAREALALAEADLRSTLRDLSARTAVDAVPADLAARAPHVSDGVEPPRARAARAEASCRQAELAEQRWGWAPTIAGFAREQVTNATGFQGRADTWAVGVLAQASVWDGGARSARSTGAKARAAEAQAQLDDAVEQAEKALADARDDQEAARVGLEGARSRRQAAAEALRVAQERYQGGVGPAVDVSLAVRDDRDAALALARAEARWAVAVEAHRAAAGASLLGGAE